MAIKIELKYFGLIAEHIGKNAEQKVLENSSSDELLEQLKKEHLQLYSLPFRVAHNERLIAQDQELNDGDVIALLPPFAGG